MFSFSLRRFFDTTYRHKKEIAQKYFKSAAIGFFKWARERVRNSCGKRAFSVRATEVLLYLETNNLFVFISIRENAADIATLLLHKYGKNNSNQIRKFLLQKHACVSLIKEKPSTFRWQ